MMLAISKLNARYGKSHVLQDLSLQVRAGQVVGLLGRNGVGKTTTLRAIMGLVARYAESMTLGDARIDKLPPDRIARLGIGYVPQGRNIFPHLTVLENIKLAHHQRTLSTSVLDDCVARFPVLKERLDQAAGRLSGGEQQMLAMSRVLSNRPKVLLLDEPVEGLSPVFVKTIADVIDAERQNGVAILLVEQNVQLALAACDEINFLEKGTVKHRCETKDGVSDEIIARYLGVNTVSLHAT